MTLQDLFTDAFADYRAERDRRERNAMPVPARVVPIIPKAERASTFYIAATLKDKPVPPREWLVPDLVPQNTVTLFGGDGGTGKSLLALQLAVGAATGTGWLGRPVTQGRVIFITAEDDDDELHRRTDDILRAEGLSYDDLSGLTLRSLAGEDALLAVETQVALIQSALFDELDARAAQDNPVLIVIDTLADVYPANENDRAKVRQFVGILRGLALKRRCAVMLLAHPSLTGLNSGSGTSGSTAWNNSVRSRLYLSRIVQDAYEPDPDARVLATKKANYGRTGGEIAIRWQAGVFRAEEAPSGLDKLAVGAKAERVFLDLLRAFTEQGRKVNHASGPTYAPKVFSLHPKAEGMTKAAFKGAMEALLLRGAIRIAEDGPPSKRRQFLEASA
ncbi:MAG: AAA family ATPase [Gemmobacter sp.]